LPTELNQADNIKDLNVDLRFNNKVEVFENFDQNSIAIQKEEKPETAKIA